VQLSLPIDLAPEGFTYTADFISADEERELLARLSTVELHAVVMHGQAAKRTVAHFGAGYGYDSRRAQPDAPPIPDWLQPLCARVARPMAARTVDEVLITKYPRGARIGWHRDAPAFGPTVAGLSLSGGCRLELRRKRGRAWERWSTELAPRSLYVLAGGMRKIWQHMIPAVAGERWSITFRTLVARGRLPSRAELRRRGDG
jgi:alkylated DNA repair dioxygenase AlkB